MRIWLDDFRECPLNWHHVKNKVQLEILLNHSIQHNIKVEIISFDHDLGLGEPDGYEIIKWMAKEYLHIWPKRIFVHSMNPIGKKNIEEFDKLVREKLL